MTPPKSIKFKYLEDDPKARGNRRLIAAISVLSNILTSAIAGKEVGPSAQSFLNKVLDAFEETFEEGPFPARTALRKLDCFERYVRANQKTGVARKEGIERVINRINKWRLHRKPKKEGRALNDLEAKKLLETQPKWRNKQRKSLRWALEQSSYMFGQHYETSYKRNEPNRAKLELEVADHYGNELDPVDVAFVVLQHVLFIKGELLKDILKLLLKRGYENVPAPPNSGYEVNLLLHPEDRRRLTHILGLQRNLVDRRRFGLW